MISTILTLPYELARLPLTIIDTSLASRLAETSKPRVTFNRALGSADKVAGGLLGSSDIAQRGADRLERSHKLVAALRLEQEATTRREQAVETEDIGTQQAARKREAAQDRAQSGLDEAAAVEARGKREARIKAEKAATEKKAAADQRAGNRTAKVEQSKERAESAAEAKKRAAQRQAEAELDDASKTARSAAEARADAERLSDLTEAKKQGRKRD